MAADPITVSETPEERNHRRFPEFAAFLDTFSPALRAGVTVRYAFNSHTGDEAGKKPPPTEGWSADQWLRMGKYEPPGNVAEQARAEKAAAKKVPKHQQGMRYKE